MRNSRKRKPYDASVYRSLALITQFGINMVVPIGMMSALGIWLDRGFGTSFWTIVLFFVGAVAGAQNVYRMAKRVYAGTSAEEKSGEASLTEEAQSEETSGHMPSGGIDREEGGGRK